MLSPKGVHVSISIAYIDITKGMASATYVNTWNLYTMVRNLYLLNLPYNGTVSMAMNAMHKLIMHTNNTYKSIQWRF